MANAEKKVKTAWSPIKSVLQSWTQGLALYLQYKSQGCLHANPSLLYFKILRLNHNVVLPLSPCLSLHPSVSSSKDGDFLWGISRFHATWGLNSVRQCSSPMMGYAIYKGLKWVTRFLDWQWFIFLRWVDIQSRMPSFISDEDCSWPPIREHEGNIVFDIHTSPPHRGWMVI